MPKKYFKRPVPEPLLTTGEIARYCHTSISQVKRWIQNNELNAIQTPGGHYRVRKDDFREFLTQINMPVIEEYFRPVTKRRLLIADDDDKLVETYKNILEDRFDDIEIETAYDGYEALIKAGKMNPDIIILDLRMPKIDGLDVCKRLRRDGLLNKDVMIIAMTAHTEAYTREQVLESGADEYLIKPIEIKTLYNLLK